MANTVKMRRSETLAKGGPTEADIHPNEVEGMEAHGWVVDTLEKKGGNGNGKRKRGRPPKEAS